MKIIVVDDEPIIADTLANILIGEGHNALAFSRGEPAIRLAEVMQPDLLVTDVMMPGMDGIETAKAILIRYPFPGVALRPTVIRREWRVW